MPTAFEHVYLDAVGLFLPGEPINNTQMDDYIAPLNRVSKRLKKRILAENGIQTRHYAINPAGDTVFSHAQLAAHAVQDCLRRANRTIDAVSLLSVGSSGGDALMPGFANMIQGELAAPPMETLSSQGVCAAGVTALNYAAQALELGSHQTSLVVTSELPSRMFKKSRFAPRGYDADFDAHFLRWMLSDGAGAMLLTRTPQADQPIRLKLKWIHTRSFSGDYPVCMQLGLQQGSHQSFLDYPSASEAEAAGAMSLRQDIRLLPHLFDIGIHEYVKLVEEGWLHPEQIDHFLCHYSSERFMPIVDELMQKAGLAIPKDRWFSNLTTRGNTGSASIFIMLADFLDTHRLVPGERIFCYVPESGRFTSAYFLIEVEAGDAPLAPETRTTQAPAATTTTATSASDTHIPPPHAPTHSDPRLATLLQNLATVWHDYRSKAWRTPFIHTLRSGGFTAAHYTGWMACWIPQVREGSKWMREANANLHAPFEALKVLIEAHATDEQFDFNILFQDYQAAGGRVANLDALRRNPGGEALNAYMHALAATPNPIGLLGAIYIIEGTGQRIIPALLPLLKAQLSLAPTAFRFLDYHGANDEHHLARWLHAVTLALAADPDAATAILQTARQTATLYLLQFAHIAQEESA